MSRVRWLLPLARLGPKRRFPHFGAVLRLAPPHWLCLGLDYEPVKHNVASVDGAPTQLRDTECLIPGEVRLRLPGVGTVLCETGRYAVSLSEIAGWLRTQAKGTSSIRVSEQPNGPLTMAALTNTGDVLSDWQATNRLPAFDPKGGARAELMLEIPVRYLRQAMRACAFNEAGPTGRHRRVLGGARAVETPGTPGSQRPTVLLSGAGELLQVIGEGRAQRPAAESGVLLQSELVQAVRLMGDASYALDARLLSHVLDALAPEERFRLVRCRYHVSTSEHGSVPVEVGVVVTENLQIGLPLSYRRTSPAIGSRPVSVMVPAPTELIVSVEALRLALAELAVAVRAAKGGGPGSVLRTVIWRVRKQPQHVTNGSRVGPQPATLLFESGVLVGARRDQRGRRLRRRRTAIERVIPAQLIGEPGMFRLRWLGLDDILLRISAPSARLRFFPAGHFVEITPAGGKLPRLPMIARWAQVPLVAPRDAPTKHADMRFTDMDYVIDALESAPDMGPILTALGLNRDAALPSSPQREVLERVLYAMNRSMLRGAGPIWERRVIDIANTVSSRSGSVRISGWMSWPRDELGGQSVIEALTTDMGTIKIMRMIETIGPGDADAYEPPPD